MLFVSQGAFRFLVKVGNSDACMLPKKKKKRKEEMKNLYGQQTNFNATGLSIRHQCMHSSNFLLLVSRFTVSDTGQLSGDLLSVTDEMALYALKSTLQIHEHYVLLSLRINQ